jgi:antitoxin (DNA-binding transcriptional repressor) of toxin-antitoxin stability system
LTKVGHITILSIGCMHGRMMKVPPMKQLNIHEAKAKLSARGKSIIIAKSGTPLARLGPISEPARKIKFGFMKGEIMIADDFDAPLPEAILRAFESD